MKKDLRYILALKLFEFTLWVMPDCDLKLRLWVTMFDGIIEELKNEINK